MRIDTGRAAMQWCDKEEERPYHPVANIFPFIQGDEFEQLTADIAQNGLLEPIWLHPDDGSIIDGRNRHRACLETDTPPSYRTWSGTGSLVTFVISLNLHRRHLTSSQRAAVAVDVLPMLEDEKEKERREKISAARSGETREIFPSSGKENKSSNDAAELFQTNGRYVSDAKKLHNEAPGLFDQVKAGEMTIPQAKRELVKRQRQEAPPPPSDKYRIIYADPPWRYGNSGVINDSDNYGRALRHYPDMSISDLCALPVREMTDSDAVLFMWVTSPLLAECFAVIKAWGFKYKTSFVWDKVGHNFGHYNSVRHELLLICTRGSCTPDNPKLFDSVQVIEKSRKHSEKPEQFREIIDALYSHGKRIELFARRAATGWETWGNEPRRESEV